MAQHTPGPWGWDDGHVFSREPDEDGMNSIAHVYENRHETANARLIAAAPDLLAALQILIGYDEYDAEQHNEGMRLAHLAIAKAEGKNS